MNAFFAEPQVKTRLAARFLTFYKPSKNF